MLQFHRSWDFPYPLPNPFPPHWVPLNDFEAKVERRELKWKKKISEAKLIIHVPSVWFYHHMLPVTKLQKNLLVEHCSHPESGCVPYWNLISHKSTPGRDTHPECSKHTAHLPQYSGLQMKTSYLCTPCSTHVKLNLHTLHRYWHPNRSWKVACQDKQAHKLNFLIVSKFL